MNILDQIEGYFLEQPESKRLELQKLHQFIQEILPECRLWFLNGKDVKGKMVSNPNIGYGSYSIRYANGKSKDFYQIGLSANTTGISIYIMGIDDKTYLAQNFGKAIGKASVTGYCIKFKKLEDINLDIIEAAILYGIAVTNQKKAK